MNILVINCGSSSLKFLIASIDPETIGDDREVCLARGIIERIGGVSLLTLVTFGPNPVIHKPFLYILSLTPGWGQEGAEGRIFDFNERNAKNSTSL